MPNTRLLKALCASVAVAIAACGGSDSTAPSGPPNIAGTWTLNLNFSNTQLAASCSIQSAVVVFTQTGASFSGTTNSGTQICTVAGQSQTTSVAGGTWLGGQINGTEISFNSQGGCSVVGTVSGNPPNSMNGTLVCTLAVNGTTFTFNGTWNGSR